MERSTCFFLLHYCCCCVAAILTVAAQTANISTDQSALLALKSRITSDPHNKIFTNWSTTTAVCNWIGVTCGAPHRRVTVLNLTNMELTGTIPPQLSNLSFLVRLSFKNNSFHGTLPLELGHLRRLKGIDFTYNNFKGIIPSWFGSLSKLQALSLYGNKFSGSISAAIFNLSALEIINLSFNRLSGSIPREIGNLTMLKHIYLDSNNFEEIPNEIGTLNELEYLFVQENALKGPFPVVVLNMSSLITLALGRNSLSGSLPNNICQYLPSIQALYFSGNQLEGPLPSKWSQCKQLSILALQTNRFGGSIPTSIGNLTQIRVISLRRNYLTGTIPHEISHLPNLETLQLDFNNLNDIIPPSIFNMSAITVVALVNNQLSGTLPRNIGLGLPSLRELYLSGNNLSGIIPKSISNASQLTKLYLVDNYFSGFIPSTLCFLPNLKLLSLSRNNLTIDISTPEENVLSCLPSLKNLRELFLSSNLLNAKLPIRNLSTSLQEIRLDNCNMRGNIPDDIGNLSSLMTLSLHHNQLSGSIPTSMGRLHNLQGLYLHGNRLQGYIPEELCQLKNLAEFYLSENQLSGSIPSCLGNLSTALRGLFLRSNLLNSRIPSTLWGLSDILKLDLSSNALIGPLSDDVGNLKVATLIELSNNQLSGSIPNNIGSLQKLLNLSLANNNLQGEIPSSVGKLLSLELLDLSKNNLSGVIPKSLEALSYLKYLNLSFNNLQGEVPNSGPFKNLSVQSFVSNHGLCGASQFHVPPCKRKTSRSILKYVLTAILSTILLVAIILWMVMLRRKKNMEAPTETTFLAQLEWRRVSYNELASATNGFNESVLLGTGGFGSVYKGTLSDGMDVAIKVYDLQLEGAFHSFESECEMLANLRHRNLIKVISCCSQIDFKAVVLNYMPNGSLEKYLYSQNFCLNILQRLNILIDVASALEYLHYGYERPIVHCDLKPSNILLDDDMGAHVADFGIAKLLDEGESMTQTMTLATIGYMAPEYGMEGIVTIRGDVYSFGIVVMETFTKRKPTDEMFVGEMSLKQWVANSLFADAIVEIVDTSSLGIEEDHAFVSKRECISSIMRLALACCAESPEERINMEEALSILDKIKIKFLMDAAGGVVMNHHLVRQPVD